MMKRPTDLLLETALRGELHHALILHGPSDVALRDAARALARAVNCEQQGAGEPCPSCSRIDRDIHPDVHWISVAGGRKMISIEQIRSTINEANLRPYEGKSKVFILDPADAMSLSGSNAILKTLEEPAANTLFILLTRSADLLLPTIRSRSQSIPIRPPAPRSARQIAAEEEVPLQQARLLAAAPDPESAETMIRSTTMFLDALAEFVDDRNLAALLSIGNEIASADDARLAMRTFAILLRDLAALDPLESMDGKKFGAVQSGLSGARLLEASRLTMEAINRLVVNADPRLLVERSLVHLAR